MSSTESDDDSGIATDHLSPDDPLDELDGVGPHRASELPYGSIEGLSRTTADQVYETDGISVSKSEAEHIMSQANDVMDNGSEAEVEEGSTKTFRTPDEKRIHEARTGRPGDAESVSVDELDPSADEPVPDMEDADTVGIIVGMATSEADESVLADLDDDELLAQFHNQLVKAGLDSHGEGWTPVILGEGMGRPEIIKYLQDAEHHEDVLQESADLNRHATARRAYKVRDEEFVEQDIDGLVGIANGHYVGKYVNLAYDANIPIHTPPMDDESDDDEDPDGLEMEEA